MVKRKTSSPEQIELARMAHGAKRQRARPLRRRDGEAARADALEVLAARDQRHLMTGLGEQRADAAADAAGAVDDDSQYGRSPLIVTRWPERVFGQ